MKKLFLVERKTEVPGTWCPVEKIRATDKTEVLSFLETKPEEFVVYGDGKVKYIIPHGINRECRIIEIP